MKSSRVLLLLIGICYASLISQAYAECCKSRQIVFFKASNETCKAVGAVHESQAKCKVVICADGSPYNYKNFCGRSRCDSFGCNCECRTGKYYRTFLEKNRNHQINVTNAWFLDFRGG